MSEVHSWQTKKLSKLFDLVNGASFSSSEWADDGLPIIRIQNLNDKAAPYNYFNGNIEKKYCVSFDDLLFAWSGSRGTSFGPYIWGGSDALLNQHIFNLRSISAEITQCFAFMWLKFILKDIENEAHGSAGLVHITKSELGAFEIPLPPIAQQQKIAKILSTVDKLIEKTQTLINKYTAIKQGMMADLFTRGIDLSTGTHHGKLRPSVEDAPELYKETELGWVPKAWEVLSFSELADYKNGNSFAADDWKEEGYPIIRIQNLNGSNEYNYYEGPVKCIWHILPGDLLFAWSGQKGVSFGARIWNGPEGVLNQHIFKVYENSKLLNRQFLYYLFKLNVGRIEDNAHGFKDSFVHVTRSELTEVKVRVPPKSEQIVIENRAISLEINIEIEEANLKKHKKIKKGLMQDLLTGKVKVVDHKICDVDGE